MYIKYLINQIKNINKMKINKMKMKIKKMLIINAPKYPLK
jgi:hypothetical protein